MCRLGSPMNGVEWTWSKVQAGNACPETPLQRIFVLPSSGEVVLAHELQQSPSVGCPASLHLHCFLEMRGVAVFFGMYSVIVVHLRFCELFFLAPGLIPPL